MQTPPHLRRVHDQGIDAVASAVHPHDFWFSADLKSGHHAVDMHPSAHKYLGFRWEGEVFVFTSLP